MFEDIVGYNYVKDLFSKTYDMYEKKEMLEGKGIDLPKSILLYGEIHHGKSYMANIFSEAMNGLGYEKILLSLEEKIDEEDVKVIEDSFTGKPTSLFIEGFKNSAIPETLTSVLLDYQQVNPDYFIIGVSDETDFDDEEDWPYAGLFDMKMRVDEVSYIDTNMIITKFLEQINARNIAIDDVSAMIQKCRSYKMIMRVLNDAYIKAHSKGVELSNDIIVESFNYYEYQNDDRDGIYRTDEDIIETAIHEAGHAVVHFILGDNVAYVSMIKNGRSNGVEGVTYKFKDEDNLQNTIIGALAGMAAVEIKFHRNASGISGDITQAVHCARRLICFNAYYGFRLLDVDPGDKLILSDSQRQAIVRLLEEKYDQAKELLIKYDKLVDYVSGELLSKGYVFRSELLMMKNKIEKSYKKNIR